MPKNRKKHKNARQVEKQLFIICEGQKTEFNYLKKFIQANHKRGCQTCIQVLPGKHSTPDALLGQVIKCIDYADDEGWVVFDKDGFTKHEKIFEEARKNNIRIAFSSISFEYWVLIHYKYSARAYKNSEDLIRDIKKCLDYKKNDTELYKKLASKTDIAKANAREIRKYQEKNNGEKKLFELNPYTNVDVLLKEIKNFLEKHQ